MKNILLFGFLIAAHCTFAQEDFRSIDPLFDALQQRIERNPDAEPNVQKAYNHVIQLIDAGEIGLNYDSTLNYGLRACAAAIVLENGMWALKYGDFVLDIHENYPLLAEAIIMHEFQHLYDGTTKPELLYTKGNPIEETYYELDGIFIEALFLMHYSDTTDRRSSFDNYLAYDLQNGMESIALIVTKVDITLLHSLDEVREFASTEKEAIAFIAAQGDSILSQMPRTDSNWLDYQHAVAALTYVNHIRQLVHDIVLKYSGENLSDSEVFLKKYPAIKRVVDKIFEAMKNENYSGTDGLLTMYSANLMGQFEAELLQE